MKILAICVLFNPSEIIVDKWKRICNCNKNTFFYFVDNSEKSHVLLDSLNCNYMFCGENIGIAAAQNIGIDYAIKYDFSHVLFFDQDSDIDESYICDIFFEFERVKNFVPNLAMLGPLIIDKDCGKAYKNDDVVSENGFSLCSALISSGSITSVDLIKKVGLMEEKLFIDFVDFEWCWRAQQCGLACARTHKVLLSHKVGLASKKVLGFPIIISKPFRYFYQYRNMVWMLKRDYVPLAWKIKSVVRAFVQVVVGMVIFENKRTSIKFAVNGLLAGFRK